MIFPLWESNPITDLQMTPFGVTCWNELIDPDDIGNWTMAEFADYVKRLKETLPAEQFTAIEEQLPAPQALLEDVKRKHRNVDVKRAQAEIKNLRYAMRVVKDRLEDPDNDKQVIVNGSSAIVVSPGG